MRFTNSGLLILVLTIAPPTWALQKLSETAIYTRCHSHLTGHPPHPRSKTLKQVAEKKLTPLKACQNLFMKARLNSSGSLSKEQEAESQLILNRFHDLHFSWLNFKIIQPASNGVSDVSTRDHLDASEPALYWTRALLQPGVRFDSIVTSSDTLRALRSHGAPTRGAASKQNLSQNSIYFSSCNDARCNELFAQTGALVGVESRKPMAQKYQIEDGGGFSQQGTHLFFRHFGAGVLGNPTYIFESLFESYSFKSDGEVNVPRIWATAALSDLFCRQLPLLRPTDIQREDFLQPDSSVTFRKSQTCLRCHATIDPMSNTLRGFHYIPTPIELHSKVKLRRTHAPFFAGLTTPSEKSESGWPAINDPNHYKRPPRGRLFFRNYRGKLVDRQVKDLSDLGQVIAQQDDLFMCAASRYYSYFTGITLELADPYSSHLDDRTQKILSRVEKLSTHLKQEQSLEKLIFRILDLPEYGFNHPMEFFHE